MTSDSESNRLCLYHASCPDGVAAAWAVSVAHPGMEMVAVDYTTPVDPSWGKRNIILVDFCFPLENMMLLVSIAGSVLVIDHHATIEKFIGAVEKHAEECGTPFELVYDKTLSGAELTFKRLFPDCYAHYGFPAPIRHTGRRDLWDFRDPRTRVVCDYLSTLELTPQAWAEAFSGYEVSMRGQRSEQWHQTELELYQKAATVGPAIAQFRKIQIERILADGIQFVTVQQRVIPVVNVPRVFTSELLGQLALTYPFAVGYTDLDGKRTWSLRASAKNSDAINVRLLAESLGGGGHAAASGFTQSYDELYDSQGTLTWPARVSALHPL